MIDSENDLELQTHWMPESTLLSHRWFRTTKQKFATREEAEAVNLEHRSQHKDPEIKYRVTHVQIKRISYEQNI